MIAASQRAFAPAARLSSSPRTSSRPAMKLPSPPDRVALLVRSPLAARPSRSAKSTPSSSSSAPTTRSSSTPTTIPKVERRHLLRLARQDRRHQGRARPRRGQVRGVDRLPPGRPDLVRRQAARPTQEEMFNERISLVFKRLRVVRMVDTQAQHARLPHLLRPRDRRLAAEQRHRGAGRPGDADPGEVRRAARSAAARRAHAGNAARPAPARRRAAPRRRPRR